MDNLIIFNGILKTNNNVIVRKVDNFNDFEKVLVVFQNFPYNEILSKKECQDEYDLYMNNGYIFASYVDNKIAGINCILNDVPEDYSIKFHDKTKVAYYSGLAVIENYRKLGLGKILVKEVEKYLEDSKAYDFTFARILCEKSMSEGIFKQNGFTDAYYDGSLITDDVTYLRNTGEIKTDKRKYMIKRLTDNNSFFRR